MASICQDLQSGLSIPADIKTQGGIGYTSFCFSHFLWLRFAVRAFLRSAVPTRESAERIIASRIATEREED